MKNNCKTVVSSTFTVRMDIFIIVISVQVYKCKGIFNCKHILPE